MKDLNDNTPARQTIYLKDYTPASYSVQHIDLTIQVFADYAITQATLTMQRQHAGDLELLGRELELLSLTLNDKRLTTDDYHLTDEKLTITNAPDNCTLVTQVKIYPQQNTALEGLYQAGQASDTMFVTQCEPEGFRKITFYPDRPDVLASFTTRLEADKSYPTLLANGNLVDKGELPNNRHFTVWHDPTLKPSYLFACVLANLSVLKSSYTTIEGRKVALEIYTKRQDIEKCHVAMQALKDAMHWDETHYGRAYDLDVYMIVAVGQFNMGAMENKGLNIFNTSCVLSSPTTTTDVSNFFVKGVIAHEYFHNWTGNRITCRDWFQLCLKEGFTVFRDQSFSETLQSPAVQRIVDVANLRARQFAEDAGPLAHPPRPDHFVEINNFYTATVYEKGAEIVRMIANFLGKEKFRQGTDEYFNRFDGQAVTVEDLLTALSTSGVDVMPFLPWYTQPGTPKLTGSSEYNTHSQTLTLTFSQKTRHVAGYPKPQPLPIPIACAIFDKKTGKLLQEEIFLLTEVQDHVVFTDVSCEPVVSVLRNFSAPVLLDFAYSDDDLAFLMQYETNGFNRWQATQTLVNGILQQQKPAHTYLEALAKTLPQVAKTDAMLASRLLDIPSETELSISLDSNYAPDDIKQRRDALKQAVANKLKDFWVQAYHDVPIETYADNSTAMGKRAWRNSVLQMALTANINDAPAWAHHQFDHANCMTEQLGALQALVWHKVTGFNEKLQQFHHMYHNEALVIDLWFGVQAANPLATVDEIVALSQHPEFDLGTPNRIRAVTANFARQPTKVWTQTGVKLHTSLVAQLDGKNPVLASRLLQSLSRWYTLVDDKKAVIKTELETLTPQVSSKNVTESLAGMLKEK